MRFRVIIRYHSLISHVLSSHCLVLNYYNLSWDKDFCSHETLGQKLDLWQLIFFCPALVLQPRGRDCRRYSTPSFCSFFQFKVVIAALLLASTTNQLCASALQRSRRRRNRRRKVSLKLQAFLSSFFKQNILHCRHGTEEALKNNNAWFGFKYLQ